MLSLNLNFGVHKEKTAHCVCIIFQCYYLLNLIYHTKTNPYKATNVNFIRLSILSSAWNLLDHKFERKKFNISSINQINIRMKSIRVKSLIQGQMMLSEEKGGLWHCSINLKSQETSNYRRVLRQVNHRVSKTMLTLWDINNMHFHWTLLPKFLML